MATGPELKNLAKKRIQTTKILIKKEDWEASVYMMAMVLELALKAATCKSLKLDYYPDVGNNKRTGSSHFKTHNFDRLLLVSGCQYLFTLSKTSTNGQAINNWSDFTTAYLFDNKDWTEMRYDERMLSNFDENKVNKLFSALYLDENSIIKVMGKAKKW